MNEECNAVYTAGAWENTCNAAVDGLVDTEKGALTKAIKTAGQNHPETPHRDGILREQWWVDYLFVSYK